jgi:3-hydroxyisobutyrate dehydrogenase-like beta-hydroxyacid dehydrogenase
MNTTTRTTTDTPTDTTIRTTTRLGFIGLGMMGHGMAKNLLAKGQQVVLKVNQDRSRLPDLLALGGREAATLADCAREADVVFICVTGSQQIEQIVYAAGGLLASARAGMVVVDTSTAEPHSTARIREDFARAGVRYVDAPLSRTPKEAEEGRLNCMVGADDDTFAQVEPLLRCFCENVFHVGPPGHGHVLKLVSNMMAMSMAAGIAEAMALSAKAGLDLQQVVKVISAGGVNSGIFQGMAVKTIQDGDLAGMKFSIANATKDLRYVARLADRLALPTPIAATALQAFVQAVDAGLADRMVASLFEDQEARHQLRIVPR